MPTDNQREDFIKQFVQTGKSKGASKEEVSQKLELALREYDSMATPQQAPLQQPQQKDGIIRNIAKGLGLGTVERNIATGLQFGFGQQDRATNTFGDQTMQNFALAQQLTDQAKQTQDPQQRDSLLQRARAVMQGSEALTQAFEGESQQRQETAGITEKEVERGSDQFALRRGVGQSAELASWMLGPQVGAATPLVRAGQAGLRGLTVGGLQGVSSAARSSDDVIDAAQVVATGAVTGAALSAGTQLIIDSPQIAKQFWNGVSKALRPKAIDLYKRTLKENISDRNFYKQFGGEEKVAREAAAYKLPTERQALNQYLEELGPNFNSKVTRVLSKPEHAKKTINLNEVREEALKIVKKNYGSDQTVVDSAQRWLKTNEKIYSGQTGLASANKLRVGLDRTTGDKLAEAINQGPTAMKKALATVLRDKFKSSVPELKPSFREYQLVSGLAEAMRKEPTFGLSELTGAVVSSGVTGFNPMSAIAGVFGAKAVRSPALRRSIAAPIIRESARTLPQMSAQVIRPEPFVNPTVAAMQRALEKEKEDRSQNRKLP